nr:hypothetical protein [Myxococcota bacterium]
MRAVLPLLPIESTRAALPGGATPAAPSGEAGPFDALLDARVAAEPLPTMPAAPDSEDAERNAGALLAFAAAVASDAPPAREIAASHVALQRALVEARGEPRLDLAAPGPEAPVVPLGGAAAAALPVGALSPTAVAAAPAPIASPASTAPPATAPSRASVAR